MSSHIFNRQLIMVQQKCNHIKTPSSFKVALKRTFMVFSLPWLMSLTNSIWAVHLHLTFSVWKEVITPHSSQVLQIETQGKSIIRADIEPKKIWIWDLKVKWELTLKWMKVLAKSNSQLIIDQLLGKASLEIAREGMKIWAKLLIMRVRSLRCLMQLTTSLFTSQVKVQSLRETRKMKEKQGTMEKREVEMGCWWVKALVLTHWSQEKEHSWASRKLSIEEIRSKTTSWRKRTNLQALKELLVKSLVNLTLHYLDELKLILIFNNFF